VDFIIWISIVLNAATHAPEPLVNAAD
jgi:hypothetical protein